MQLTDNSLSNYIIFQHLLPLNILISIVLSWTTALGEFYDLLHTAIHYSLFSHGNIIFFRCGLQITYVCCIFFDSCPFLI